MKFLSLFLVAASLNLFAAEPTIVGTWHLDEWQVTTPGGVESEFCQGANGLLIYEESGHVSTAINCPKTAAVREPADAFQRQFFYAGTFSEKNDVITKVVSNSTVEGLIGKTVLRYIQKLNDKELILTGPFGPKGGTLWIRWTR